MKIILNVFLVLFIQSSFCKEHPLLSLPQKIHASHLKELVDEWAYKWNWHFVDQGEIEFHYSHNKAGFIIRFFNAVPEQFKDKEYRAKSEFIHGKRIKIFEYIFGHTIKESDAYEEYREIKPVKNNNLAHAITIDQLISLIKDKKVVFYTGAGISAAANIKTLDQLEKSLGVDRNDFNRFVQTLFKNSQKKASYFKKFAQSIIKKEPTQAHQALTKIAEQKSAQILTENIDFLHQRTGLQPLCLLPSKIDELTSFETLQEVDAIICIGMSRDNVGFLEQYKQKNKKGIIVALDLKHPNYIGKGDFFLQGDVQYILPTIEQLVCI